jgi:hypothetical protein
VRQICFRGNDQQQMMGHSRQAHLNALVRRTHEGCICRARLERFYDHGGIISQMRHNTAQGIGTCRIFRIEVEIQMRPHRRKIPRSSPARNYRDKR